MLGQRQVFGFNHIQSSLVQVRARLLCGCAFDTTSVQLFCETN